MAWYTCENCSEDVSLDEVEEGVFKANDLLYGSQLLKCPYCIESAISASVSFNQPRSSGTGAMYGELSGFFGNTESEEATVEPRKKNKEET